MTNQEKKSIDITKVETVKQMLDWKKSTCSKSIESKNKEITDYLEWKHTDALYSFLGIYALGVYAYNDKNHFKVTKCLVKDNETDVKIYNLKYLSKIQSDKRYELKELNNVIKRFIKRYSQLGNVFPTWPGGNTARGNASNGCFDIPELYFAIEYEWFLALRRIYKDTIFFDGHINRGTPKLNKYSSLDCFLKTIDTPEKYTAFLDRICRTIDRRTEELEEEYSRRKLIELSMKSQAHRISEHT